MAYDPLGLDQEKPESAAYDPLALGPQEKEPSYLEAAKTGLKEGLVSAARMFELPIRPIVKYGFPKVGINVRPEQVLPSELLKPSEEEERRAGELGIPGQIVRGLGSLPGAALKYGPLMALAPAGIIPTAATFATERGLEELEAGKPIPEIGKAAVEEGIIGGVFRGIEPLRRAARSAILGGTFSIQAFADTYAQTKDMTQSLKAAIAPGVIGAGMGLLGEKREERPIPRPGEPLQIPTIPESRYEMGTPGYPPPKDLPYPVTPYRAGEPPMDMVWNPKTGRYEPGDFFGYETGTPGPEPNVSPQLPYFRGLPQPGMGEEGTWRQNQKTGEWYQDLGRRNAPIEPSIVPDWIKEGREFPPPEYPPVIYDPLNLRSEAPKIPGTVPPGRTIPPEEKGQMALIAPLSDSQMAILRQEGERIGGLSRDLIMRWAKVGSKRADATLEALRASDQIVPTDPGDRFPWKFKERIELPGDRLRYAGEIRELRNFIASGEPGLKKGAETGETVSWSSSYPTFIRDKGWTKGKALNAIDRGMRGDDFKGVPNLKEIWEATKMEAKGIFKDRVREQREARRVAIRETDPRLDKPETIKSLTDTFDDEIMGFREELKDEGWSEETISRAIEDVRARIESEEAPPDFESVKQNLSEELDRKPEKVIPEVETEATPKEPPELSATAKNQFALPGIKQGLEMAGAKEGVAPTLEGTPLMEAARKAEIERVQPGLFQKGAAAGEAELFQKEEIPPTAQHLEEMPEEYPNIKAVAVKQDGEIYTDHVHGEIIVKNNLDPEKAIPGFLTKEGAFVEQYPKPPLNIGDKVRSGDFKGTVEQIDPESILIKSPTGETMLVSPDQVESQSKVRPAVMADGVVHVGSDTHDTIPPETYSEAKDIKVGVTDKQGNFIESKAVESAPEPPPIDFSDLKAFRKFVESKGIQWPLKGKEAEALKKEFDDLRPGSPEKMGIAYVKDQKRYFTDSREITKGKDKGKVEITLTNGKRIVITKDKISRAAELRTGETPTEPLTREAVQGFADVRLRELKNAPETEIIDMADIPERLANQAQENIRKGIKGIYDPVFKKIYLIRDMMGSETDVIGTINHEAIGHYASEAFLGKDANPFFNRVYMKYGKEGLREIAEERGFDLDMQEGRLAAAREKFAQMSEAGGNPGLIKQFYAWIREQLRKIFPDLKLADAEIQMMIKRSKDFLVSGEAKVREARIESLRRQVGRISEEQPSAAQFSIAKGIKESARATYEEEVKPKGRGAWDIWMGIRKAVSPTTGVDVKDMDTMMKLLGDREMAKAWVEVQTEKGIAELSKLSRQEQIDLIDKIQTGYKISEFPENLREYARLHREIEDSLWMKANDALSDSDPAARIAYLEGHVRNFWKVLPKGLEEEINRRGFEGLWRRPLEGTRAPLYQQYYTLKEGMEKGGVPFTTNLLEITRLNHEDTYKLITAHDMWNAIGSIGHRKFIKFGEVIPEGFRPLNDRIANRYFPPKEAGRWVVEDNVGRLLENYLSRDYVRESPALRGIMGIKNITTALELGFSAFHASFITWETIASQIGLGMRKIWNQGMIKEGLKDILEAPITPYKTYKIGKDIVRLFKTPDEFIASTGGQEFLKMFPEGKEMIGDLFWGGGSVRMAEAYRINSINTFRENLNSKNYIGAALRSVPALSQWMMKPLFENYIPSLKRAVFFKEFSNELLGRHADLMSGKVTRPEIARNVWTFVENRFGEMNFDNLWWNRTFKSSLQMVVRSVTWKLGNIRGYGKAITGQSAELLSALKEGRMPKLTQEMAWVWGLASVTAAMAGITQYAFTGKQPEDWKDLVYPQIDKAGGRLSLPTYMRDLFHATHSPIKYMSSSLAGWIGRFNDVINNKDFYGVQIHDPSENVISQRIDDLIHLAPLPFSVESMKRMKQEGEPPSRQLIGFFGATKAPYWIERTNAEQKASELKAAHLPVGGRTTKDFERGQLVRNYARRYQEATLKGDPTDEIMSQLHDDVKSGKLYMQDLLNFRRRISKEPLIESVMHLPFRDVLEVWNVASTEERKKLAPILNTKFYGLRSPEDRITYMPKIREIMREARSQ